MTKYWTLNTHGQFSVLNWNYMLKIEIANHRDGLRFPEA